MVRRVFFSFHYVRDNWRAAQVRNIGAIGAIEGNQPATDNDWETVKNGGDSAIKRWISNQMHGRSCTVVLVGTETAGRKWIKHEIIKSWKDKKGVVGIHIHGLQNSKKAVSKEKGRNPFDDIVFEDSAKKLSSVVRCYNPPGGTSSARYRWIGKNLADIVEEAIDIRKNFQSEGSRK